MMRKVLLIWVFLFACLAGIGQPSPDKEPFTVYSQEQIKEKKFMLLVNKHNRLPEGFIPEGLQRADTVVNCSYVGTLVNGEVLAALKDLFDAAAKAQFKLILLSAYRNASSQDTLYHLARKLCGPNCLNLPAAPPLASEHHTGFAVDIYCDFFQNKKTARMNGDAWNWLVENAWQFGFILRYPPGKLKSTQYPYEPWHYRYGGKGPARIIKEEKLCLEEYLGLTMAPVKLKPLK